MDVGLSVSLVADLIGLIYDCALDPERWPETLDVIRKQLDFAQSTLTLQAMPTGKVLLNVASGIPSPWLERIPDYGADIVALWGGPTAIASAPMEEPVLLSRMNPAIRDGSSQNRYYVEWRKPQGLIDTMALGLARDERSLATASFVRHETQGPIDEAGMSAARLLAPHLRRAVTISRLLDVQAVAASTFEAVIGVAGAPILVTDGRMRLMHANPAAQAFLDRRDPLALRGDQLSVNNATAAQALTLAVAQAAEDEARIERRGLGIPLRGQDGELCALHVLPLRQGNLRAGLVQGAAAAIFIATAATPSTDVGALAAALFGLSPAEARVFDLVAAGHTTSQAAIRLGINVSTVRTHLLRIFDKTGARRQADLVKMATALSMPLG